MTQTREEHLAEILKLEEELKQESFALTGLPSYYSHPPVTVTRGPKPSVLEEALQLTTGDRQKTYGHPLEDFSRTAGLWTSLLGKKLKEPITPQEVALAMVCLKMSRQQNKNKRDNLVDMAGYVNCLDMLLNEQVAF